MGAVTGDVSEGGRRNGRWLATFVAEDRGGSVADVGVYQLSGCNSVPEEGLA